MGPDGPHLSLKQPEPAERPTSETIQIGSLQTAPDVAWDDFVRSNASATFFHLSGWKKVIEDSLGHRCHYLFARAGTKIVGILPLTHMRGRLFGNSLISNGLCVYGGPVATNAAALAALDAAALELGHDLRVQRIEYRSLERQHPSWRCDSETYVTFRKKLGRHPEEEMRAIPRKQRAMVRKGLQRGLRSEIDADISRFFPLYAESVRNLGTPVLSRRYFERLASIFAAESQILTVIADGKPVSSVLSFFFRDEVLPYYGGGGDAAREYAANDFMYWEVMRRACEAGIGVFDFGRSKVGTGSYAFKRHWGFEPQPLYYEHHLQSLTEVPAINPLNPKYAMMISLWRRLPVPVANFLGPFIARELI
jgi:FemAB-related protein (PEP-CTERM system-associated)